MSDDIEKMTKDRLLVSIRRKQIDSNKIQGFIIAYSDELVLLQYVYDFNLDGLMVLRRKDITEISSNKTCAFQTQLLKDEKLFERVDFDTKYDISNWESVFQTLGNKRRFIIVEDETDEYPIFVLGEIRKIDDDSVSIMGFSGAANWDDEETVIYYEDISSFQVGNNYANVYERYFNKKH